MKLIQGLADLIIVAMRGWAANFCLGVLILAIAAGDICWCATAAVTVVAKPAAHKCCDHQKTTPAKSTPCRDCNVALRPTTISNGLDHGPDLAPASAGLNVVVVAIDFGLMRERDLGGSAVAWSLGPPGDLVHLSCQLTT